MYNESGIEKFGVCLFFSTNYRLHVNLSDYQDNFAMLVMALEYIPLSWYVSHHHMHIYLRWNSGICWPSTKYSSHRKKKKINGTSIDRSIYLSPYVRIYQTIYSFIPACSYLSIYLSIYVCSYMPINLFINLNLFISIYLSIYLSITV